MKQRKLGKTGIEVSEISFGSVPLGIPYGFTSDSPEKMLSDEEAIAVLRAALDGGINFFDTAPLYGRSEELIGRAFDRQRDDIVICTKCGHAIFDSEGRLLPDDQFREIVQASVKKSLRTMKTDYVDVFLVHKVTEELLNSKMVVDVFTELKKQGLVRSVGVSTYGPEQTCKAISSGDWDVVQLALSIMDQENLVALPLAIEHGVGVMVRSVLFRGILTDTCPKLHEKLKAVDDHRQRLLGLLGPGVESLSELATRFVLSQKGVSSALVGIDRASYLQDALNVAARGDLDGDTLSKALESAYPDPEFLDLPAWDRAGWVT